MSRGEAKKNFWEGEISTLSQLSAFPAGFVPTFGQMSQLNDVFSGSVPTLYDFSPAVGGGSPPHPPHKIAPVVDHLSQHQNVLCMLVSVQASRAGMHTWTPEDHSTAEVRRILVRPGQQDERADEAGVEQRFD